jgi:hypothetical protein
MILELLKRITISLESKNIPYMLSGSLALNTYTIARMTMDIDIVIELQDENISTFLELFGEDFYLDADTVKIEIRKQGMFNIIDQKTSFKIDFIIRKDTEYRKLEFDRKRKNRIADFDVWMVTPEDLIISKLVWIQQLQSERQMNDIENLLDNSNLDLIYIKEWCRKLNLKTFNLI